MTITIGDGRQVRVAHGVTIRRIPAVRQVTHSTMSAPSLWAMDGDGSCRTERTSHDTDYTQRERT